MVITKTELRKYIRHRFPIGTVIHDSTCSVPYTIKKNSVFEFIEWNADSYNDTMRPENEKDYTIEFFVRDTGKDSRMYDLGSSNRGWVRDYIDTKLHS